VSGVTPTMVQSLADPVEFPVDIRLMNGGNSLFAISRQDSALTRATNPQPLCRIYFSAVTDSVICIDNIRDVVNQNTERVVTYTYGGCVPTSFLSIQDMHFNGISISPNPVQGALQMELTYMANGIEFDVVDPAGRVVMDKRNVSAARTIIDVSGLSNGMYVLRVFYGGEMVWKKFSKL
ncbi:MAG: T9SS type A sorting domain-containing protein, partial [Bacteroidia bacterium]